MSVLSRLAISSAPVDLNTKRLFRDLLVVNTVVAAGSASTNATGLTTGKNVVTASDGTKGVILPVASRDMAVLVVNTVSGSNLLVYPASGEQINALTATTGAFTVPGGNEAVFLCDAGAHWYVAAGGSEAFDDLTVTNPIVYSNATGITAFATGGQASATALTEEFNNVTTCAAAGDSVKLPTAAAGLSITVKNSGATSLAVFPFSGDSINALAVNLSVNIPVGGTTTFRAISATVWETNEVFVSPAPTTQRGEFVFKGSDNAADHEVILTNASHGQATTVTVPDVGLATSYVAQSTAALTAAEVDVLDGVTPGASAASKALITDSAESLLWTTTDATASETVTLDIEDTRTAGGATGWAIKGGLNANVALGSYANGVYGILNFTGSSGAVTGLGAGIAAEIVMGAGTGAGTYAALELELGMPTGALSGNSGTSFIYAQVYGADKATFDTSGYVMNIQGLTAGTSKTLMNVGTAVALADFTVGLRVKVGATDYVIPLITAAEFAS